MVQLAADTLLLVAVFERLRFFIPTCKKLRGGTITIMLTATIFFDKSLYKEGDNFCYYCGAKCDNTYSSKEFVKDTFTNRDIVFRPNSEFVCGGCVASFSESSQVILGNGEIREDQRVRQYSWVIDSNGKTAYTKAHLNLLRQIVINPPKPPFSIVLTDSGQKHLVFRSKISMSNTDYTLMLEDTYIDVNVEELKKRFEIVKPIIAAIGKVAISEKKSLNAINRIFELHGEKAEKIIDDFYSVQSEKLTKLAVWLAPNKEECFEDYRTNDPIGVPAKTSRTDRPIKADKRERQSKHEVGSDPLLFDFS